MQQSPGGAHVADGSTVHRCAERIVDAILPAGAVLLEICEDVAVEFQRHEFLDIRRRAPLDGGSGAVFLAGANKASAASSGLTGRRGGRVMIISVVKGNAGRRS